LDLVPFLNEPPTSLEWPSGFLAKRIATYLAEFLKLRRPSMCFLPCLKMVDLHQMEIYGNTGPGIMFMVDAPAECFE
jgi:hypothetical protein